MAAGIIFAIFARVAQEIADDDARRQAIASIKSLGAELQFKTKRNHNSLGSAFTDSQYVSHVKWYGGYGENRLSNDALRAFFAAIAGTREDKQQRENQRRFFDSLSNLKDLEVLVVSGIRVTENDLDNMKQLTKLRELHLANTLVTRSGLDAISHLSELETLSLEGNPITDDDLTKLANLRKLKWLWVRDTEVTETGVRKFRRSLVQCRVFYGDPNHSRVLSRE